MKILQLDGNDARKLFPTATQEFKEIFIDTWGEKFFLENIMERIKSYEDACEYFGLNPREQLPYRDTKIFRQEAANAFVQLDIIAESLRERVLLDWTDSSQKKWFPVFTNYSSGSGFRFLASYFDWSYTLACGGARLCLDTKEKSDYFGTQFLSIWNKFLNPNK